MSKWIHCFLVVLFLTAFTFPSVYASASRTDLGDLGGNSSDSTSVNELGQVVGSSRNSSFQTHGFITHPSTEGPEHQVSSSSFFEFTPILGNDGTSDLVVYASSELGPNGFGPSSIFYQRLNHDGSLRGNPVTISDDALDNQLPDTFGDFIVYTSFESVISLEGEIKLYQISTGNTTTLSQRATLREARIHGNWVAWIEGRIGLTVVKLFDLNRLNDPPDPANPNPIVIGGGNPAASSLEIGQHYVVWEELKISSLEYDIAAYDLASQTRIDITTDTSLSERFPHTNGSWVVWESDDRSGAVTVEAVDLSQSPPLRLTIADNGGANLAPTVEGDRVAYESNIAGNFDIYVYRFSTGETVQVTTSLNHQRLNNVFDNKVAYVDDRNGDFDVFISNLDFVQLLDLGTLGGIRSHAADINNLGHVVGLSTTPSNQSRAFLILPVDVDGDNTPDQWNSDGDSDGANDLMINLGTLGNSNSRAQAINDRGIIVGDSFFGGEDIRRRGFIIVPEDSDGDGQPDLWNRDLDGDGTNDLIVDLGGLPDLTKNFNSTTIKDINEEGWVVGYTTSGDDTGDEILLNPVSRGFIIIPLDTNGDGIPDQWFQDQNADGINDLARDVGTLGGMQTIVNAVNNLGEIVGFDKTGFGNNRAFVLVPEDTDNDGIPDVWLQDSDSDGINDLMTEIGTLSGTGNSRAMGINNFSQVVGVSDSNTGNQAFLWTQADGMTLLNNIGDGTFSSAIAISDPIVDQGLSKSIAGHIQTSPTTPSQAAFWILPFDDADGDSVERHLDSCPINFNPDQVDSDGDGAGDVCDVCPTAEDDNCDVTSSVSVNVGVDGGMVQISSGNAQVDIGPGNLSSDTSITISGDSVTPTTSVSAFQVQTGAMAAGLIYTFLPEGTTFNGPITITLQYDDSGIDESTIDIYFFNPVTEVWEPQGAVCDTSLNVCSLQVDHFSEYIVGGFLPDTTPPVIVTSDITIEATGPLTPVDINAVTSATDNLEVVSLVNDNPGPFPVGSTSVVWEACDAAGNCAQENQTVTVTDTTAPDFNKIQVREKLWPPNGRLRHVVTVSGITDLVDDNPNVVIEVTHNQIESGKDRGISGKKGNRRRGPDWRIEKRGDTWRVFVRAERYGNEGRPGRVYTITASVTDSNGNVNSKVCTVLVPHDRSDYKNKKKKLIRKIKKKVHSIKHYYKKNHSPIWKN